MRRHIRLRRRFGTRRLALGAAAIATAVTGCGNAHEAERVAPASVHAGTAPRAHVARKDPRPRAARRDSRARREPSFLIARLRGRARLPLRARPGGRVVTVVHPFTIFGSRTVLSVVHRARGWAAVTAPHLPNGSLGWFRVRHAPVQWARTRSWIKVDLSARTVEVGHGKRVVDKARVGIGMPGAPTPRGRFAITDKLSGKRFGSAYGRFILALSGTQTKGVSDWHGPRRLAIHGTPSPAKIGQRASLGCLVASDGKLARIVHEVRLGTPVIINA